MTANDSQHQPPIQITRVHLFNVCADCQAVAEVDGAGRCPRCVELIALRAENAALKRELTTAADFARISRTNYDRLRACQEKLRAALALAGEMLSHDAACWRIMGERTDASPSIKEVAVIRADSLDQDTENVAEALR